GYVVPAWLAGIIINLLLIGGYYDVALRDFGLLVGALALARLAPPVTLSAVNLPPRRAPPPPPPRAPPRAPPPPPPRPGSRRSRRYAWYPRSRRSTCPARNAP